MATSFPKFTVGDGMIVISKVCGQANGKVNSLTYLVNNVEYEKLTHP